MSALPLGDSVNSDENLPLIRTCYIMVAHTMQRHWGCLQKYKPPDIAVPKHQEGAG